MAARVGRAMTSFLVNCALAILSEYCKKPPRPSPMLKILVALWVTVPSMPLESVLAMDRPSSRLTP